MFFTYLRRELRRRARQASIIAIGLALGIGLVITVTALSSGVKNAQSEVLHSLYGQDTDITVTKTPAAGSFNPGSFGFRGNFGTGSRPAAGTKIDVDTLRNQGLGTLTDTNLATVAKLDHVAAAAGGLTLTDTKITGTIPAINSGGGGGSGGFGGGGGGSFRGSFTPTSFSVDGVDLASNAAGLGPLSAGKLTAGRTLNGSDGTANVALVDANYAKSNKIAVGSTATIAKTSFKVVGIVSTPAGATFFRLLHPARQGAGTGRPEERDQHDLRDSRQRSQHQHRVQVDLHGGAEDDGHQLLRPGQSAHRLGFQRVEPGEQPG